MDPQRDKRESGVALLVVMLMLALVGMIGVASLNTVMRSRQTTGFQNMAQSALYAADAGVAEGLDLLREESVEGAITAGDCLTSTLPTTSLGGGRSFEADPSSTQICMLATTEPCAELDSSIEAGAPSFLYTVWNVRVKGNAPGGASARVQATAGRCHAFTQ